MGAPHWNCRRWIITSPTTAPPFHLFFPPLHLSLLHTFVSFFFVQHHNVDDLHVYFRVKEKKTIKPSSRYAFSCCHRFLLSYQRLELTRTSATFSRWTGTTTTTDSLPAALFHSCRKTKRCKFCIQFLPSRFFRRHLSTVI